MRERHGIHFGSEPPTDIDAAYNERVTLLDELADLKFKHKHRDPKESGHTEDEHRDWCRRCQGRINHSSQRLRLVEEWIRQNQERTTEILLAEAHALLVEQSRDGNITGCSKLLFSIGDHLDRLHREKRLA